VDLAPEGRCALCGSTDRVEAHRVIALREGGSNDAEANGMALCFRHHRQLEREREPASRARGRSSSARVLEDASPRLILGEDGAG
jgi:hypothetical protein